VQYMYPISITYGVAFGAYWCLVPAISSEVFGLSAFASVYTALIFAPALGCWLLSAQLAGRLYDAMSSGSSSQLSSWLNFGVKWGMNCTDSDMLVQHERVGAERDHALQLRAACQKAVGNSSNEVVLSGLGSGVLQPSHCFVHQVYSWLFQGCNLLGEQVRHAVLGGSSSITHVAGGVETASGSSSSSSDQPACVGPACFRLTFVVLALLCGAAVAASVSLTHRTAARYRAQQQPAGRREHELV
jgi:hypothetical protein